MDKKSEIEKLEKQIDREMDKAIAKSKKFWNKWPEKEKKLLKQREKRRKHFYKKLKITNKMSQESINNRILAHLDAGGEYLGLLTDEQQNDPSFMLRFYQVANGKFISIQPSKTLQQNYDFMMDYFKIVLLTKKETSLTVTDSVNVFKDYKDLVKQPAFLEKLEVTFPECNITHLVDICFWDDDKLEISEHKNRDEFLSNLPKSLIMQQASKFGAASIKYLPKNYPALVDAVTVGVLKDGFSSLVYLNKKDILKHKDLITLAYQNKETGGVAGLRYYLLNDLTFQRVNHYQCHGENHVYDFFDSDYLKIQKTLLNDEIFFDSFKLNEYEKIKIKNALQAEVNFAQAFVERENFKKAYNVELKQKKQNQESEF